METQTRTPSTIISVDTADVPWITPTNALVSDDIYTTASFTPFVLDEPSEALRGTNGLFSLPEAVIHGIEFRVERKSDMANAVVDFSVLLLKGGVTTGTDHATLTFFPTTEAYQTFGGPTDLWGTTWTSADINDSGFGAQIIAQSALALGEVGFIDHIELIVYHTPIAPGVAFSSNLNIG